MNTGFPASDATAAFARQRRRQSMARLGARLRRRADDLTMLPLEDVVASLGRVAESDLGLQSISLASIVGTTSRSSGDFDRAFRPGSRRLAHRWQRIATARARGEILPPIDVYRIGDTHFVQDGHHRVSVARAHGDTTIDARVREVHTRLTAAGALLTTALAA